MAHKVISSTQYCSLESVDIGIKIDDALSDLRDITWDISFDLVDEQQLNQNEVLADILYRIETLRNLLLEVQQRLEHSAEEDSAPFAD